MKKQYLALCVCLAEIAPMANAIYTDKEEYDSVGKAYCCIEKLPLKTLLIIENQISKKKFSKEPYTSIFSAVNTRKM